MTTPAGNQDNIVIDLLAKLDIDTGPALKKIEEMFASASRAAGTIVAGAAAGSGAGGAKVNEAGEVKQNAERSKVRTDSLKHLAQQFPGGGLMTSMASAFKGGGMMAGVATGITAAVAILTNIMKSSQVFQNLAGTVFKVLGFMADVFLMPFIPMMMRFVQWMLTHMPEIQAAGEKVANFVEKLVNILGYSGGQTEAGKEAGGVKGMAQRGLGFVTSRHGIAGIAGGAMIASGVGAPLGVGMVAYSASGLQSGKYQLGGRVPGGPGGEVPAMLHGGEIVVPQDIAAAGKGMSGRVAAWIERFQQKEMGPSGVMGKWYDSMFGSSILPDIWNNIRGLMVSIEGEADTAGKNVASSSASIDEDNKGFWASLKIGETLGNIWGNIKEFFKGIGESLGNFWDSLPIPEIDFGGVMNTIGEKFGQVKDAIMSFFTETIPQWYNNTIDYLWSLPGRFWNTMTNVGSNVGEFMGRVWDAIKSFFTDTIPRWFGNVISSLAGLGSSIISGTMNVAGTIGSFFQLIWEKVSGFFTDTVFPWLGNAAMSVVNAAKSAWGSIGDVAASIKGYFTDAYNAIKDWFKYTLPSFAWAGLSKIWDITRNFWNFGEDVWNSIKDALSSAYNAIKETILGWGRAVKQWIPFLSFGNTLNLQSDSYKGSGGSTMYPGAVKTVAPAPSQGKSSYGNIWDYGGDDDYGYWHYGNSGRGNGSTSGRVYNNESTRIMNIQVSSNMSVAEIVNDIDRLESMNEASFFNGVM